jgi:hypothetical protein
MEGCSVTKQFWIFLVVGLAVVGALVYGVLLGTKGAHVDLTGEILKVRVLAVTPQASLVVVDFRVTNPADVPFVVNEVRTLLDDGGAEPLEGAFISKPDVNIMFKYGKLLGPKYNDVLSIRDKVAPHQTVDRMVGTRFELPESRVDARKGIRLRIEEVDGAVVEIGEKK